jgi:hypothetical protein
VGSGRPEVGELVICDMRDAVSSIAAGVIFGLTSGASGCMVLHYFGLRRLGSEDQFEGKLRHADPPEESVTVPTRVLRPSRSGAD